MNELYRLCREASFFIMPANAECVGMSFIEAASFGLPAIGKNTGGVPEAVLHNHSGLSLRTIIHPATWPNGYAGELKTGNAISAYQKMLSGAISRR